VRKPTENDALSQRVLLNLKTSTEEQENRTRRKEHGLDKKNKMIRRAKAQ
jgi:hypothetical protein